MTETLNGNALDAFDATFVIATLDTAWVVTGFCATSYGDEESWISLSKWNQPKVEAADVFIAALNYETDQDAAEELIDMLSTPGLVWYQTECGSIEGADEIEPGERPQLGVFRLEYKPVFTAIPATPARDSKDD